MSDKSPKTSGKSYKHTAEVFLMNAAVEAHHLFAAIAGPMDLSGRVKAALAAVARKTGIQERRVRAIWHKEARVIRAEEMDTLRRAARAREKAEHDAEMAELWAHVARLEMIAHKVGRILAGNPHFEDHWADIAGYARLSADRNRGAGPC